MLAELTPLDDVVFLVRDSGIQFMDFGVALNPKKMLAGAFVNMGNKGVSRLLFNHKDGSHFHLGALGEQAATGGVAQEEDRQVTVVKRPHFDLAMDESLKLLDGVWLPLPYFRFTPPHKFDPGPTNWARMRLLALDEPDRDGNNYRLTIAFDTKPLPGSADTTYLAPSPADVHSKAQFRVACHTCQLRWFLDQQWTRNWLEEVFRDAHRALRTDRDQVDAWIHESHHLAHYLNVLSLLAEPEEEEYAPDGVTAAIPVPRVHLSASLQEKDAREQPIPVDLILDVGNSRTCGILIEDQEMTGNGLKHNYVLQMRDLNDPERLYSEPFASRIEFAQMTFGKENHSKLSGRHDAFQWPTIARVGTEASRLCARRSGSEGSTGLSSPKRYLWDQDMYAPGWRFSTAFGQAQGTEAMATAAPFSTRITDAGTVFYAVEDVMDRMPAFSPNYTRSSLMTFMLAEVVAQALSQINSVAQRTRMGHAARPRKLASVTLTVPPGMPQIERSLLQQRLQHAVALVWQCMGWDDGEKDPYDADRPAVPVRVEWDEAACGQLVYLYTEICENFKGHPDEFFDVIARPDKKNRQCITLASVDIGGGTTDLVVNDYSIDTSLVGGIPITPKQRFRDSFKVAGDDILLDVIQKMVLPALETAFAHAGVAEPGALMSRLSGDETITAQAAVLRQQLNLQVFVPIGLAILRAYETFDPEQQVEPITQTFAQWMGSSVSENVAKYVADGVRYNYAQAQEFDVGQVPLMLDLARLHKDFVEGRFNICKVLDGLCEIVAQYPCDVLLLTGRPSMLPGVQAYMRRKMAIPPGRIISMHGYTTNGWYPFNKGGKIVDPKTTAVVGAMLCFLSEKKKLFNFYFNVARLRPYSTMRHIGSLDKDNLIPDKHVLYRDVIKIDEEGYEYLELFDPDMDEPPSMRVLGNTRIGFRQLDADRWIASPLYVLQLTKEAAEKLHGASSRDGGDPHLKVRLKVERANPRRNEWSVVSEGLAIDHVDSNTNKSFNKHDVTLKLCTMNGTDSGASTYWIDSGSVK